MPGQGQRVPDRTDRIAPRRSAVDGTFHLQGHGHLHGRELIVIAARDDDHQTVVLTAEDWDAVHRASTDQRRDLLTRAQSSTTIGSSPC